MTDKKTPLLLLLLILLASCAHEETNAPKDKTYSSSTQKEFERIEKAEVQKRSIPPAHNLQQTEQNRRARPVQKEIPIETVKKEPVELSPSSQITTKGQERLQEINQNLAYYCMKHRNDGAFSSEEQCLKFTKKILKECEQKHKLINTVMVNCIKDRLKKRR